MLSSGVAQTERYGQGLAQKLSAKTKKASAARVIALVGELGAGKTAFVRGFARGLGIQRRVTSPTFVLARRYRISSRNPYTRNQKTRGKTSTVHSLRHTVAYRWFWHVDCYRLKDEHDLKELGFHEILKDPRTIVVIEWAERIRRAIPRDALWITLRHIKRGRAIYLHGKSR